MQTTIWFTAKAAVHAVCMYMHREIAKFLKDLISEMAYT